jgi:hypothetical protein
MNLVQVISSSFNDAKNRVVKFFRYGPSDVQTSLEVSAAGVDSNPVKGMVALYAATSKKGKTVIIGYIKKDQLADVGELRLFSTNAQGAQKTYLWLKNDGNMEVGGDDDNLVRYSELKKAFDELKGDVNGLIQKFNTHVHPGVTSGLSSTLITVTLADPSTADVSGAKIDKIKTTKS